MVGAPEMPRYQTIGRPFVLNPVLFRELPRGGRWSRWPFFRKSVALSRTQTGRKVTPKLPTIIGDMFITQPPINEIRVLIWVHSETTQGTEMEFRIQEEGGVKFKHVIMAIGQDLEIARIQLLGRGPPVFVTAKSKLEVEGTP